jgi:DnaJ-domain-containing protein 1
MRRSPRSRAFAPDPAAPGQSCDSPGCPAAGEYRAPRSRTELNHYYWFCLEHVRAYNASWDFYKGMSPAQIETALRADTAWGRPTWPLGRLGATAERLEDAILRDPLGLFGGQGGRPAQPGPETPAELREPLAILGLDWPVSMDALKTRYKSLAKQHHPDANNGDRGAEERLKDINLAYAALRKRVAVEGPLAQAV